MTLYQFTLLKLALINGRLNHDMIISRSVNCVFIRRLNDGSGQKDAEKGETERGSLVVR